MKKYNTHTDVKTFEDACAVEKLDAKKVIPDFKNYPVGYRKAMISHAKLIIIAHALNRLDNNGKQWKPDWNNGQWDKYYPWFYMGGSSGFRVFRLRCLALGFGCRLSPLLQIKGAGRLCWQDLREVV